MSDERPEWHRKKYPPPPWWDGVLRYGLIALVAAVTALWLWLLLDR